MTHMAHYFKHFTTLLLAVTLYKVIQELDPMTLVSLLAYLI